MYALCVVRTPGNARCELATRLPRELQVLSGGTSIACRCGKQVGCQGTPPVP